MLNKLQMDSGLLDSLAREFDFSNNLWYSENQVVDMISHVYYGKRGKRVIQPEYTETEEVVNACFRVVSYSKEGQIYAVMQEVSQVIGTVVLNLMIVIFDINEPILNMEALQ